MDHDVQARTADWRRSVSARPEALHMLVRAASTAPEGASLPALTEPSAAGVVTLNFNSTSALRHDLVRSVEDYVELIARFKQIDELPAGHDELRWQIERDAMEALGRVRRGILGLSRQRGLA